MVDFITRPWSVVCVSYSAMTEVGAGAALPAPAAARSTAATHAARRESSGSCIGLSLRHCSGSSSSRAESVRGSLPYSPLFGRLPLPPNSRAPGRLALGHLPCHRPEQLGSRSAALERLLAGVKDAAQARHSCCQGTFPPAPLLLSLAERTPLSPSEGECRLHAQHNRHGGTP